MAKRVFEVGVSAGFEWQPARHPLPRQQGRGDAAMPRIESLFFLEFLGALLGELSPLIELFGSETLCLRAQSRRISVA